SRVMPFADLQQFVQFLEKTGRLKRIRAEVDPELEVTEITQRVLRENGPALLFERPRGSSVPLVMNLFGTMDRVRAALGREPSAIGNQLLEAMQRVNPPSLASLWENREVIKRAFFARPRMVHKAVCHEIEEPADLSKFPVLKCWPGDAGRFITYGMVLSHDP